MSFFLRLLKAFTRFNACSRVTFSLFGLSTLASFLSNFTAALLFGILSGIVCC